VPLNKTKNDEIVTAYDMKAVEKMGLLKMDFLGLTTLTVIDDCLKLIEQTAGRSSTSRCDSAGRSGDVQEGVSHGADVGRVSV
jgi:DNA polymerase III alpha subunit